MAHRKIVGHRMDPNNAPPKLYKVMGSTRNCYLKQSDTTNYDFVSVLILANTLIRHLGYILSSIITHKEATGVAIQTGFRFALGRIALSKTTRDSLAASAFFLLFAIQPKVDNCEYWQPSLKCSVSFISKTSHVC